MGEGTGNQPGASRSWRRATPAPYSATKHGILKKPLLDTGPLQCDNLGGLYLRRQARRTLVTGQRSPSAGVGVEGGAGSHAAEAGLEVCPPGDEAQLILWVWGHGSDQVPSGQGQLGLGQA